MLVGNFLLQLCHHSLTKFHLLELDTGSSICTFPNSTYLGVSHTFLLFHLQVLQKGLQFFQHTLVEWRPFPYLLPWKVARPIPDHPQTCLYLGSYFLF